MKQVILLIAILLLITGCGILKKAPPPLKEKTVVFLIDKSGSYDLVNEATQAAAKILHYYADDGDIWYFSWIKEASYGHHSSIFTLELPSLQHVSKNPFDPQAKRETEKILKKIQILKKIAIGKLTKLKPTPAPYTNIYGGVAKASDLFKQHSSQEFQKYLILATDLKDNIGYKAEVSLEGVVVIIFYYEVDKEPQISQQRLEKWENYFFDKKAKQVYVIMPQQSISSLKEILK